MNVFCLFGPTCVGKTDIAVFLSEKLPVEIISVDSGMFYKHFDLGTGKPSKQLLSRVKHHLIDIRNPEDTYSIFDFCIDAYSIVESAFKRNVIPIFVGGSMMYFWVLQSSFFDFSRFNFINIAILPVDKYKLYNRIKERFYKMLDLGFVDEVRCLYSRNNLNLNSCSMKAIGYKDMWLYLDGKILFEEAKTSIINSTIELSVKQMVWIKKWNGKLFYVENKNNTVVKVIYDFIDRHIV